MSQAQKRFYVIALPDDAGLALSYAATADSARNSAIADQIARIKADTKALRVADQFDMLRAAKDNWPTIGYEPPALPAFLQQPAQDPVGPPAPVAEQI